MENQEKRKFNIYCDESSVENTLPFFVIGALLVPREQKTSIVNDITDLRKKHSFFREVKWNKTTTKHKDFYVDLVRYFAQNNDIEFKSILVKKVLIDMKFHDNDTEKMFYKFYYQLLKRRFKKDSVNYIFTDFKTRKIRLQLPTMHKFLNTFEDIQKFGIQIKHLQEYDSQEIELLQMTDFLTGAVAYANNYEKESDTSIKGYLVEFISRTFDINLGKGSNFYFEKFNIFKWIPRDKK